MLRMAEDLSHTSVGAGEYEEWNRIWSGLTDRDRKMYTRGNPRTCRQLSQRCYFEDLWSMLGESRAAKCLEMGAGRGTTSMYLTAQGCDVTMLDLAPEAFAAAARNFRSEHLPVPKFVTANATNTGIPKDSFDCIYSIGLLEHFDDPRPLLVETLRLLRPGGLAFHVVVPTIPERRMLLSYAMFAPWKLPPRRLKDAVKKLLGRDSGRRSHDMTRTEFDVEDYRRWLLELSVVDVTCVPYNAYHLPHGNRTLERLMVVPAYRVHRAWKRRLGRAPWMRTGAALAACVLVAFRKPACAA